MSASNIPLPSDLPSAHCVINDLTLKNIQLVEKNRDLQQQLDWFKRQVFGQKSEKIIEDDCGESGLRFDSSVPVDESIVLPDEAKSLSPDEYEIIDTKVTERLCQKPAAYYVKRTLRPVVKLKNGSVKNAPAPEAVFERSYADASLVAGIAVEKFQYYQPLYRQHLRMTSAGIMISRANLTNWIHRGAKLLEPVYQALLISILESPLLAMDETPLKAGVETRGKLHQGYVWALYGDRNEAGFIYSPTRAITAIEPLLKDFKGTLITDGYTVYEKLVTLYQEIQHALCWAHTRREFYEAREYEPTLCDKVLGYIGQLYQVEQEIRGRKLKPDLKLQHRVELSKPVVDELFQWLRQHATSNALLPSNKFSTAANYALKREHGLRMYLKDPDVPIDTNHLEREIRPIPLGRKNWLFCWSEVGAEAVAIFQSLISSCKLAGHQPFEYLEDVLRRLDSHPLSKVAELIPRNWKPLD